MIILAYFEIKGNPGLSNSYDASYIWNLYEYFGKEIV